MTNGAPAAPTGGAAPSNGTPNAVGPGTQAGGGGQSPAPAPKAKAPNGAPTPPPKARANDGRFLSKDGNVGVEPQEPAEGDAAAEVKKEAYRLKRKAKVYGEEIEFDLDEDGLVRELTLGRARAKKMAEAEKFGRVGKVILDLMRSDPAKLFQELKIDPDQWATERLNQRAQRNAMSPEERRAAEAEAERDTYKAQIAQIQEAREAAQKQQEYEGHREAAIERYGAAIKEAGMKFTHLNVFHMAEVEREAKEDGIEYSPRELAAEAKRRLSEITNEHLGSLDGSGLVQALGPERVKLILRAAISEFQKAPGIPGVETKAAQRTTSKAPTRPTSESELSENLRRMRMGEL